MFAHFSSQCGAASLADYLWRTLQGMGFGPEELLLHACGAGSDLPPLHAAVASGEPAAVSTNSAASTCTSERSVLCNSSGSSWGSVFCV